MDIAVVALVIDLMIGGLTTRGMIVLLAGGMVVFGGCIIAVFVSVTAWDIAIPVSYATDVRAEMTIDLFAVRVIGVVPGSDIAILACVVSNMCRVTSNALESIPMLPLSEEAFCFDWAACSC